MKKCIALLFAALLICFAKAEATIIYYPIMESRFLIGLPDEYYVSYRDMAPNKASLFGIEKNPLEVNAFLDDMESELFCAFNDKPFCLLVRVVDGDKSININNMDSHDAFQVLKDFKSGMLAGGAKNIRSTLASINEKMFMHIEYELAADDLSNRYAMLVTTTDDKIIMYAFFVDKNIQETFDMEDIDLFYEIVEYYIER